MRERIPDATPSELCQRLNQINWSVSNPTWENILIAPTGKVLTGKPNVSRAAELIAHRSGAKLTENEKRVLLQFIHGPESPEERKLPLPVIPCQPAPNEEI